MGARHSALLQVKFAKAALATQIYALMTSITNQETKLQGMIQVVAGEVLSPSAQRFRISKIVDAELKQITTVVDGTHAPKRVFKGKVAKVIAGHRKLATAARKNFQGKVVMALKKL